MGLAEWIATGALVVSLLGSLIGFLVSDAKNKARMDALWRDTEEHKKKIAEFVTDVATLKADAIRCQSEREEQRRNMERLENSKVSKEVFDGFRGEFAGLRQDLDKRFDRVERLIEQVSHK